MAGNKNSGRKPKTTNRTQTEQILAEGAPGAARYMVKVADGQEQADPKTADACKFIIEHTVGKPGQKVEVHAKIGPAIEMIANPPEKYRVKTMEPEQIEGGR